MPPPADLATLEPPVTRIRTDEDVETWKHTTGFRDYAVFVRRLNDAVLGRTGVIELASSESAAARVVSMLQDLANWIKDIPPQPTPQRFGNLSFREWGRRLEERANELIARVLGSDPALQPAVALLAPYLLTSFGSFVRIDYGTGHELSFGLFLLGLSLLGVLPSGPEADRETALVVFREYMQTVWALQDVYRLEPAGSHGVWGLDDYSFLGYLWGSAQLIDTGSLPNEVLRKPIREPESSLYLGSIDRVHKLKHGPFHEHSPQLFAIASQVPHWQKVNSGMFKMYEAEVLSKRVVVQHLPLGGLVKWDPPSALPTISSTASPVGLPSLWAPSGAAPPARKHPSSFPAFAPGASTNILPPPRLRNTASSRSTTGTQMSPPPQPGGVGTAAPWAAAVGGVGTAAPWSGMAAPMTGAPWAAVSTVRSTAALPSAALSVPGTREGSSAASARGYSRTESTNDNPGS